MLALLRGAAAQRGAARRMRTGRSLPLRALVGAVSLHKRRRRGIQSGGRRQVG